jgi:hypothetical protein
MAIPMLSLSTEEIDEVRSIRPLVRARLTEAHGLGFLILPSGETAPTTIEALTARAEAGVEPIDAIAWVPADPSAILLLCERILAEVGMSATWKIDRSLGRWRVEAYLRLGHLAEPAPIQISGTTLLLAAIRVFARLSEGAEFRRIQEAREAETVPASLPSFEDLPPVVEGYRRCEVCGDVYPIGQVNSDSSVCGDPCGDEMIEVHVGRHTIEDVRRTSGWPNGRRAIEDSNGREDGS